MKYVDFKTFTDENGAKPIYLFEGEEAYFREKGEQLVKSRFVQEPTLDYASFDGGALKGDRIKTLVDAVNSFPFVSQKRVVRVTEFYPTEKEYDAYLKPILETPNTDSILLIVNTSKAKTGNANFAKKPNVTHVDCSRADEETIKKWIYVTCKREGVYADGVTCGKIAAYCTLDMARISKETEKLLCYCRGAGLQRLTDQTVDALIYPDSEYKIYELANALSRKNYAGFIKISQELMTKGFNEHSLLSSLASYFRTLYETSLLKGGDREVATVLGIKEYAAKKNREQAAKFTKEQLLFLYEAVYGAISDVKCGKLTPTAAWNATLARLFFGNC